MWRRCSPAPCPRTGWRSGDELLLQREIRGDGKNQCRVNGRLVTVSQLRELGQQLLNIHGQHDGQQLLDPACHLGYLDRFGKTGPALEEFQAAFQKLSKLRREISALRMDEAERSRRVDTLTFQIQELERAELKPGEDVELDARKNLLSSAEKLMDAVREAEFALSGDEDSQGAAALIVQAEKAIQGASRFSDRFSELGEKLNALRFAADEAADQLRDLAGELDFSPEELDELEGRLDVIYRLKRKYGPTVDDMLDFLEKSRQELDQIALQRGTVAEIVRAAITQVEEAKRARRPSAPA